LALALTDLLGGQVQVMFGALTSSIGYINADKLRALAVTTATRSEALPDLPRDGSGRKGIHLQTERRKIHDLAR
jgi:hypothetical protein